MLLLADDGVTGSRCGVERTDAEDPFRFRGRDDLFDGGLALGSFRGSLLLRLRGLSAEHRARSLRNSHSGCAIRIANARVHPLTQFDVPRTLIAS
jgi:hypothetical protein